MTKKIENGVNIVIVSPISKKELEAIANQFEGQFKEVKEILKKELEVPGRKLLIPICLGDKNHWVSAIIENRGNKNNSLEIKYFDSSFDLNTAKENKGIKDVSTDKTDKEEQNQKNQNSWLKVLFEKLYDEKNGKSREIEKIDFAYGDALQQSVDSVGCGAFTIENAIRGLDLTSNSLYLNKNKNNEKNEKDIRKSHYNLVEKYKDISFGVVVKELKKNDIFLIDFMNMLLPAVGLSINANGIFRNRKRFIGGKKEKIEKPKIVSFDIRDKNNENKKSINSLLNEIVETNKIDKIEVTNVNGGDKNSKNNVNQKTIKRPRLLEEITPILMSTTLVGGRSIRVTVVGNYAYVADKEAGLKIINISNPASPSLIGRVDTGGYACEVTVIGNYAYVIDHWVGLETINISNPATPTLVGSCHVGDAWGLTVLGSYAYVASASGGLKIINISNPTSPSLVESSGPNSQPATSVAVFGNYAYVTGGYSGSSSSYLQIINISNPASPSMVGSLYMSSIITNYVTISGSYAYVTGSSNPDGNNGSLYIVNVLNPASPSLVGSLYMGANTCYAAVSGSYAYVTVAGDGKLSIINVSNPASPSLVGSLSNIYCGGVMVFGNYAYVACGEAGLKIINILNPASPSLVGSLDADGWTYDVAVSGDYAYVVNKGLKIIDISNPASPILVGILSDDKGACFCGIAVSGSYAYIRSYIINISNPSAPSIVGDLSMSVPCGGMTVSGNYAYVAGGSLYIMDISNPAAPSIVGNLDLGGGSYRVAVLGGYAYVAAGAAGLKIINISNPATPRLVGSYGTNKSAYGIAVLGSYAYVANYCAYPSITGCSSSSLDVINISNPASPQLVGSLNNMCSVFGVAVSGGYAYVVGYMCSGIIDISNPAVPSILSGSLSVSFAYVVRISGNYAYIADGDKGLKIFRVKINKPIINVVSKIGAEDTVLTFTSTDFTSKFTDIDGDSLTKIQIVTLPANGTLKLSGTAVTINQEIPVGNLGNLTFEPNPDWNGSTSFTWKGYDGIVYSAGAANVNIVIDPVNDVPVLKNQSNVNVGNTNYVGNQPAIAINENISISDVDNTQLSSATISITTNFSSGEDFLEFANQDGITGSYNWSTGVLTLTGSASIDNYITALRSVKYKSMLSTPAITSRTISFKVNDGSSDSNVLTSTVSINAPVISSPNTVVSYTYTGQTVVINPSITITDPDNTELVGAMVSIGTGFVSTEDLLEFTTQNGITGSYNTSTGELTLIGNAGVNSYKEALQSVRYKNTAQSPNACTKTITFKAKDVNSYGNSITVNLIPVPVLANGGNTVSYTEGQSSIAIDSGITISYVGYSQLTGATVSISSNFVSSEDLLEFTNQNGITGTYDSSSGILSLSGSASISNYQTALQSTKYKDTSNYPSTTPRTITFKVNDGTSNSNSLVSTINVISVNTAPVISTQSTSTVKYTEGQPAVAIDALINVVDDNPQLTGATISIFGGFISTEDVLEFTNQNGITGSYNASTGVLTLTGTATVSNYETALRSVKYKNTSQTPNTSLRTIKFKVNDGTVDSNTFVSVIDGVIPVNSAPTVSSQNNRFNYNETGKSIIVNPDIEIADPDNTQLSGATVSITENFVSLEDLLEFTNQNGITGSYSSSTGILALTGSTSLSNYQTALRSVKYKNTSQNPNASPRTITFQVNDGNVANNLSNLFTTTLIIMNKAPIISSQTSTVSYTENQPAIVISSDIVLSDPDNTQLSSSSISITNGFVASEDILEFTNQNGITGNYNKSTGILSLAGTATIAQYQEALRSVKYKNTSESPNTAIRTIIFKVSDGFSESNNLSTNISIIAVNDPPTVSLISKVGAEDTALTFSSTDFIFKFVDPEGDSLTKIQIITLPVNGILKLSGTAVTVNQEIAINNIGNLTFEPNANWNGSTSFTWKGYDGIVYSTNQANVDITITPVNDPPTVNTISKSGTEDTVLTFGSTNFITQYSDIEGDNLSKIQITSLPNNGVLKLLGTAVTLNQEVLIGSVSNLTFEPNANWNGNTSFAWKGFDGIAYSTNSANVNIAIAPVNDFPTVSTVSKSGTEDTVLTFTLTDFISKYNDIEGDSLTKIQIVSLPTNGVLKLSGTAVTVNQEIAVGSVGNLTFEPNLNWNGSTSFTWKGFDGTAYSSNPANVDITITPVNDPPTVSTIPKSGDEDTALTFTSTDFISKYNDIEGDSLAKIQIVTLPMNGAGILKLSGTAVTVNQEIAVSSIGNLTFEPNANWNGSTSFTWKGYDGTTYSSTTANVDINIAAVNDYPIVSTVSKLGAEDAVLTFTQTDFSSRFSDVDGDSLTKIQIVILPVSGTGILKLSGTAVTVNQEILVGNLGNLTFEPNLDWNGNTSFAWKGFDGITYSSNPANVDITITAVNDSPTVGTVSKSGAKDTALTFTPTDFTSKFSDVDGDSLNKIQIISLPANGTLKLSGTTVTVNQEIPVGNLGNLTFEPNADWNGSTSFNWKGFDGISYSTNVASVNIKITTGPVITTISKLGTEDTAVTFTIPDFTSHFSNVGGGGLTKIQVVSLPANGTLKLSGTAITVNQEIAFNSIGNLTFEPNPNWNGSTSFTWKGYDGTVYSTIPADVNIAIAAVNDPPVVNTVSKSGTEDTVLTFGSTDFISKYSDVEGDSLTKIQIISLPANGTLKLSGIVVTVNQEIPVGNLGNLTFEPNANWNGNTSFTWKGFDGAVYSTSTANVNVAIAPVNDAPIVSTISKSGAKDTVLTFTSADFMSKFSDVDGDNLNKIQIVNLPANGVLKLSGTVVTVNQEIAVGSVINLTFEPNANWNGDTSFSWKGYDGSIYSNTGNVDIKISSPPTVSTVPKSGTKDAILMFTSSDFTSRFSDTSGGSLTKIQIISLPEHGTLKLSGTNVTANQEIVIGDLGNLIFIPDANWNGNTSFSWRGSNGVIYSASSAIIVITITQNEPNTMSQSYCDNNPFVCYGLPVVGTVITAIVAIGGKCLYVRYCGGAAGASPPPPTSA